MQKEKINFIMGTATHTFHITQFQGFAYSYQTVIFPKFCNSSSGLHKNGKKFLGLASRINYFCECSWRHSNLSTPGSIEKKKRSFLCLSRLKAPDKSPTETRDWHATDRDDGRTGPTLEP